MQADDITRYPDDIIDSRVICQMLLAQDEAINCIEADAIHRLSLINTS
jgi:hypothetical protein